MHVLEKYSHYVSHGPDRNAHKLAVLECCSQTIVLQIAKPGVKRPPTSFFFLVSFTSFFLDQMFLWFSARRRHLAVITLSQGLDLPV